MGVGEPLTQPALGLVGGGFTALLRFPAGRFHVPPDPFTLRLLPGQFRLVGPVGLVGVAHQPVRRLGLGPGFDPSPHRAGPCRPPPAPPPPDL